MRTCPEATALHPATRGPGEATALHPVMRGALMLVGDAVERLARVHLSTVPPDAIARREARDGTTHHITLATKAELRSIGTGRPRESLLASAAALAAGRQPVPLGLGSASASRGPPRCWFVALVWPEAQAARAAAGLPPASLHITLGFVGSDVHNAPKGALQLLPLPTSAPPPSRDWEAALGVARELANTPGSLVSGEGRGFEADAWRGACREQVERREVVALVDRLLEESSIATDATPAMRCELSRIGMQLDGELSY